MVLKIFHNLNYSMIAFTVRIKEKTILASMLLALSHATTLDNLQVFRGSISAHMEEQQLMGLEGLVSPRSVFPKSQI